MTLRIDGQRFGRLLAVSRVGSDARKKAVWRFLCDCGSEIDLPATLVRTGHTQSCGCLRVELARESVVRDISGMRFGRLLVGGRVDPPMADGRVKWSCLCDCGASVVRTSKNFVNGSAGSCGCLKREASAKNIKDREVSLVGLRFGKLVVCSESGRPKRGVKLWLCRCDCGLDKVARHGDLQKGYVISCGCAAKEKTVYMSQDALGRSAVHNSIRRARKKGAGGRYSTDQVKALLSKQRGRCAGHGCGVKLGSAFHRDHIIPLSLGGKNDIGNIQLLCRACNLDKSDKMPEVWAKQNGLLI